MRHRIHGKQLNRDSEHRRAMIRNLAAGLFEHGRVETTMAKAKAVQPFAERIITIAKQGTFSARRQIESRLTDRKIHAWVADSNVPDEKKDNPFFDLPASDDIKFNRYGDVRKAPRLVQHILTNVAPLFADRDGGYTRIVKTGRRRLGDGTDLVLLELVGQEDGPEIGGGVSGRRQQADRRTAFAAKLRKGVAGAGAADAADTGTAVADEPAGEAADEAVDVVGEVEAEEVEMTEEEIAQAKAEGAEVIEAEVEEEEPEKGG